MMPRAAVLAFPVAGVIYALGACGGGPGGAPIVLPDASTPDTGGPMPSSTMTSDPGHPPPGPPDAGTDAGVDAGPPLLDPAFGDGGVLELSGKATGMTAPPSGGIAWIGDATQIYIHRMTNQGGLDSDIASFGRPTTVTETPTAIGSMKKGADTFVYVGAKCTGADFTCSFMTAYDTGYTAVASSPLEKNIARINAIAYDGTALLGAATIDGTTGAFVPGATTIASNAEGVAVVADGSGNMYGAAIAKSGGAVTVQRAPTAWATAATISPPAGAENVQLLVEGAGLLAAGFTRGGKAFFQRIGLDGQPRGTVATMDLAGSTIHFGGAVQHDGHLVIAGCISTRRPWVGTFDTTELPPAVLRSDFLPFSELACANAIAVDSDDHVVVLIGTLNGPKDSIARLQ